MHWLARSADLQEIVLFELSTLQHAESGPAGEKDLISEGHLNLAARNINQSTDKFHLHLEFKMEDSLSSLPEDILIHIFSSTGRERAQRDTGGGGYWIPILSVWIHCYICCCRSRVFR